MKTQKLLRRLRRAIRSLYLVHGLLIVLLYASVLLSVVYLGDRLLDYPRELRLFQILLFGSLSLYVVYRYLVKPAFLTPIRDDDLAVLIERTHPQLHERFITLLQAQRNEDIRRTSDPRFLSLMEERVTSELRSLHTRRVLRLKGITRRFLATAAVVSLVSLGAAFQSEYLPIFWQRLAGLDVPWPRETTLLVTLRDREGNPLVAQLEDGTLVPARDLRLGTYTVEIPRFNSMRVEIRAEGKSRETARLLTEGNRIDEVTRSTQEQKGAEGVDFHHTYREVARDFSFWVESGDDRDRHPTIRVTTYEPPVIRGIWAEVEPPSYLPEVLRERMATLLPHGNVKALSGSRARITLLVEGIVTKALATCEPAPDETWREQTLEPIELTQAPPAEVWRNDDWKRLQAFRLVGRNEQGEPLAGLPVTGDSTFQYRIHLEDKKGRRSERPNTYLVTPERDDPPNVSLRVLGAPGGTLSTQGSVVALVEASDRYDVAQVDLNALDERVERNPESESIAPWTRALLPAPLESVARAALRTEDGRTVYALEDRLDLESFRRAAGDGGGAPSGIVTDAGSVLTLFATARDAKPGARTTRSGSVHLNVLEVTDYLRVLERHLKEIRADAEGLRLRETEFLATLGATRRAIAEASSEAAWSREDVRFDRYPEKQEASRIASRFSTILQGVLLNRIGTDIADPQGPGTSAAPGSTRELVALDSIYARILERGAEGGLEETLTFLEVEVLDQLGRDPKAVSNQTATLSLLEIGGDLSRLLRERYSRVTELSAQLIELESAPDVLAKLDELTSEQRVLLETLTKILDALNRWDSFESILLDWRKATDALATYRRMLDGTDN